MGRIKFSPFLFIRSCYAISVIKGSLVKIIITYCEIGEFADIFLSKAKPTGHSVAMLGHHYYF